MTFDCFSCKFVCFCVASQPVVTSQMGTVNNVIQVKKTDFEVFDALMVDSQKCSDMSGECQTGVRV